MKYQELRDALAHEAEMEQCLAIAETITPDTLSALLAERDALEQQNKGYEAQHTRDSQELRRLCQARDDARKECSILRSALQGMLDAHAMPSSICKERFAHDADRAALSQEDQT